MHTTRMIPLLSAFLLAAVALALPPAAPAQDDVKYGFVNITQVISQSDEGQAEASALESLGAEKEEELNARREQVQALLQEYQAGAQSGEPDEELRTRIEKMQRELERDVRQAQADVDTSRQDRIQALGAKVVKLLREYGRENGFTAIFRIDGGQVVYVDPAADITEQVIEAYNEAHPVD